MRSTSQGKNIKKVVIARPGLSRFMASMRGRPNLHFHLQVKSNSEANSAKRNIKPLVLPWTKIITDAMPSYADLPEHGYDRDFVLITNPQLLCSNKDLHQLPTVSVFDLYNYLLRFDD